MNNLLKSLLILLTVTATACSNKFDINDGKWVITFNPDSNTLTYKYAGTVLIDSAYVMVANKPDPATTNDVITSKEATKVTLSSTGINDCFGEGTKYTYTYKTSETVDLEQDIFIYENHPYILTQTSVVSPDTLTYNYVAAIISDATVTTVLPENSDNRVFDMPFDNDDWHTFAAVKWADATAGNTSMEATAIYDVNSRKGMVIGTVDHDTWKSAAHIATKGSNEISSLQVYSGYAGTRTWDEITGKDRYGLPRHGYVSGTRISSSRVLIGVYDDWRKGLEAYGEANALVHPKRAWDGGTIFGWQSWGGMAESLNFDGAIEVSDYFASNLPQIKNEQGKVIMILDAFWDNMTDEQLAAFVANCEKNGQIAGIYDTPYSFWGDYDRLDTWGTGIEGYVYGDIVLRANGKARKITGISLDPTHPITRQLVKNKVERLKRLGFKYIKIDFMNNAALEADSYYDPNITTGMQAYNEGLRYYNECCGDDIFLNLSIAPVWPAHFAQGRRIGCDAWGTMEQSQYTLNCMNLSWWLEKVYSFNDPDHVVYVDKEKTGRRSFKYMANWDLNLNRIRTTTGIMCGTVVLGDNFSLNQGSCKGIQAARDRAEEMMSNPEILDIARHGKMFIPVNGSTDYPFKLWDREDSYCDNLFILDTDKAWYVAVFNFLNEDSETPLDFARLGVDTANVKAITELWRNTSTEFTAEGFTASVPRQDVCIYKIEKTNASENK